MVAILVIARIIAGTAPDMLDIVIFPHTYEGHAKKHAILAEAENPKADTTSKFCTFSMDPTIIFHQSEEMCCKDVFFTFFTIFYDVAI